MELTRSGTKSLATNLNVGRNNLEGLKRVNADQKSLAIGAWETSEAINISMRTACQSEEKGYNFRLLCVGHASFEKFKLSPACA